MREKKVCFIYQSKGKLWRSCAWIIFFLLPCAHSHNVILTSEGKHPLGVKT